MENSFIPSLFDKVVLHPAIQPSTSLYLEYITIIQSIKNTIVHIINKFLTINCLFLTINCLFLTINCLFLTINCLFLTINCLFLTIKCLFLTIKWHSPFGKTEINSYPPGLIMQMSPFINIAV